MFTSFNRWKQSLIYSCLVGLIVKDHSKDVAGYTLMTLAAGGNFGDGSKQGNSQWS